MSSPLGRFPTRAWRSPVFVLTFPQLVKAGYSMTRSAVLAAVVLLCGSSAIAGPPVAQAPVKPAAVHPCVAEAKQFCKDVPYGNGQRIMCLSKHEAQLSSVCRDRLKVLQALFEFGQQQHKKAMAILAKEKPDTADSKPAPATNKPTPPPSPQ